MLFRYKKVNAYPALCLNGCRIESVQYSDSYINVVLKDGFLKRQRQRTFDGGLLSVEGKEENLKVYFTEVIPKEGQPPYYRTKELTLEAFAKKLKYGEAEIKEEYHSANRVIVRGEFYRPAKALELNHHLQMFELQFRTKHDLRLVYYYNDKK